MNQFHDIIPGSSIKMVYDRTHKEYEEILKEIDELQKKAATTLFKDVANSLVIINPLSIDYIFPVSLPTNFKGHEVRDLEGNVMTVQTDGDQLLLLSSIEANGTLTLTRGDKISEPERKHKSLVLENDLIRYEFNNAGEMLSAYDKEVDMEVLEKPSNILTLYIDEPQIWDAWDVDITYENMAYSTAIPQTVSLQNSGPVRKTISIETSIGNSSIQQKIILYNNSKRIDFETDVDWREKHRMLRTSFFPQIHTNEALCDIQYGYEKRPTHRNTSWDMAKFEIAAHKYVDLSDNSYGAALLNDCKYGYRVLGNMIDLNLLRSSTHPDEEADIGTHTFVYSFLPHKNQLINSCVLDEAAMLNNRLLVFEGYAAEETITPCRIKGEGVSMESVKWGEKENCIVIRLVEQRGKRSSIELSLTNEESQLVETDLMEWNDQEALSGSNPYKISFCPFEIKTFKILKKAEKESL